tara:strand:- start:9451 stop:9729 length:279 start_codon:yes stop_codon:yes gene_type:complete
MALISTDPITTSPSCTPAEILASLQQATVADPAAAAALTFAAGAIDTGTDMTAAEAAALVVDIAALRTAIVANNAAIDSILATLEATGLHAS